MFTDLGLLEYSAADRSERVRSVEQPVSSDTSVTSIKRKLQKVEAPREHEIYTRAWAIYSRARTRRVVQASSII